MVKLNDTEKAKLVLEARVGLTTIANVYAGRPVRSMQRQFVEEAAKKLGLPAPPPAKAALPVAVSQPALSTAVRLYPAPSAAGRERFVYRRNETGQPPPGPAVWRSTMSQKNVAARDLESNALDVCPVGDQVVNVHYHLPPPLAVNSKQLAAIVGAPRDTVQAKLDARGVPYTTMGKQRVYVWADVLAVIREITPKAPAAPKPPKAPVVGKSNMTALDRARANGLVVVADEQTSRGSK